MSPIPDDGHENLTKMLPLDVVVVDCGTVVELLLVVVILLVVGVVCDSVVIVINFGSTHLTVIGSNTKFSASHPNIVPFSSMHPMNKLSSLG